MSKKPKYPVDEHLFLNHDKFQSLDVNRDWIKVRDRIGFKSEEAYTETGKTRTVKRVWRAAAVLVILLGIGFLGRSLLFTPRVLYTENSGEAKKEIRLADGSAVLLNMNSVLTYPARFGRRSRKITFSGEGYFEIARDPDKPFIINISDRATVEVLGTSFNINAFDQNDSIMVHVVEGRVAFSAPGTSPEGTILGKNEHAIFSAGRISQGGTVSENFLSWKTGILHFEQEPMDEVLPELSKYYNREFIFEGEDSKDISLTTTIDNQDLESVLEELGLVLGLKYTLDEEQVILFRPDQ